MNLHVLSDHETLILSRLGALMDAKAELDAMIASIADQAGVDPAVAKKFYTLRYREKAGKKGLVAKELDRARQLELVLSGMEEEPVVSAEPEGQDAAAAVPSF